MGSSGVESLSAFLLILRISFRILPLLFFRLAALAALVGSSGVEPPTSCLSGMRSNLLSYEPMEQSTRISLALLFCTFGGDDGIRTHDPLLAGQVLSQLSYTPTSFSLSRSLLMLPKN